MTLKRASVVIIENHIGQILLLQRSLAPYSMCLPGGKVDPGEDSLTAAMRELLEETGIVLTLTDYNYLDDMISGSGDYLMSIYYKKVDGMFSVKLTEREHIGYTWTTKPEVGYTFAGNTDKMLELWRRAQSKL